MAGFLGDKQTTLVHHLANMKKECKIVEMKLKDRQYFTPDTLENAKSMNFSSCMWCIGNQFDTLDFLKIVWLNTVCPK